MNPYAIIGALLLAIGLAGGGYYEGWSQRGDHETAVAAKAKEKADAEKLAAVEKAAKAREDELKAAMSKAEDERKRGDLLAMDLEESKRRVRTVTVEVIKEVPTVTTVYKEAPDAPAKAIPDAIFTVGFVRLYDRALAGELLPEATSKLADEAGGADLLRSGLTQAQLLNNHADNAGKAAECRKQLNKLIDWHEGKGAAQ